MKKFLSVLLCITAILCTLPFSAVFADTVLPEENEPQAVFSFGSACAVAGMTVDIPLSLESTAEINSIGLSAISYDKDALEFIGFGNYEETEKLCVLEPLFDKDNMAIVIALENTTVFNGNICTLTFKVKEKAKDGEYSVSASPLVKKSSEVISSSCSDGLITVTTQLAGDIDLDGNVDLDDAMTLFRYSMFPDLYPMGYLGSLDFNADGNVDINDAVLLFRYSMFPDLYPLKNITAPASLSYGIVVGVSETVNESGQKKTTVNVLNPVDNTEKSNVDVVTGFTPNNGMIVVLNEEGKAEGAALNSAYADGQIFKGTFAEYDEFLTIADDSNAYVINDKTAILIYRSVIDHNLVTAENAKDALAMGPDNKELDLPDGELPIVYIVAHDTQTENEKQVELIIVSGSDCLKSADASGWEKIYRP